MSKIFTNVNNAIVDPKNFDPESLVGLSPETNHYPKKKLKILFILQMNTMSSTSFMKNS